MVKVGVDSSGHIKNPPIWIVGTRTSRKKGQKLHAIYISSEKHKELEQCSENWAEKVSAILIFRVVYPIFCEGDAIVIDKDFQGQTCKYVEVYLKKLLHNKYPKKPLMANPNVFFIPDNQSAEVKHAHIKSKNLRYKRISINEKDPNFTNELKILS